jgi:hypothetical protein
MAMWTSKLRRELPGPAVDVVQCENRELLTVENGGEDRVDHCVQQPRYRICIGEVVQGDGVCVRNSQSRRREAAGEKPAPHEFEDRRCDACDGDNASFGILLQQLCEMSGMECKSSAQDFDSGVIFKKMHHDENIGIVATSRLSAMLVSQVEGASILSRDRRCCLEEAPVW